MNWPLMTGDTEHMKQAAEITARANGWDTPKYLGEIFNWPLEQRNAAMSLAQKLKDEAIFQQTHGMSSVVFDEGVQMTQWDVR